MLMKYEKMIINRNVLINVSDDKTQLILDDRRVTITVSTKMYLLLKRIVDEHVSIEEIYSLKIDSLTEMVSTLYFNDILLTEEDDELLKYGILHNPARINTHALSIPDTHSSQWCFFGAPVDFALDPPRSPAHGPYIYRKLGVAHKDMRDIGDVAYATTDNIYNFGKRIQHIIRKIKEKQNKVIMFGGDHSLTYFSVKEMINFAPDLILIQMDAHSDINTNIDKTNDYLYHANFISKLISEKAVRTVIQLGVRERTRRYNENYLKSSSIIQFCPKMNDDDRRDLISLIKNKSVYISFDVDVLDPGVFPHVTTPLDDGMNESEVLDIFNIIKNSSCKIEGADIMEFTCGFDEKGELFNHEIKVLDKVISLIID